MVMTTPEVSDIAGIWPMLYAFFDADGALDSGAIARQVDAIAASGAHGVAVLGLASEVTKLDTNERRAFLDCAAERLAGRLPLAVTIAEPSVAGQVAFARAAEAAGARWLVLQPPPAAGAGEAELMRFFGAVAERTALPVAIQNAPQLIGVGLSNEALAALNRNHPNLCLLKAEGPPLYLRRLIEDTGGVFRVFNGRAGLELTESLRAGCAGLIPGAESADTQAAIYDLMRAGREAEAEARFRDLLPLIVFLMESIAQLVCYGKRLAARRMGLGVVHDRTPAQAPEPFGLALLERLSRDLGPLGEAGLRSSSARSRPRP
jgi:4-hydroxy-tetrahydrodipicolinate synthase